MAKAPQTQIWGGKGKKSGKEILSGTKMNPLFMTNQTLCLTSGLVIIVLVLNETHLFTEVTENTCHSSCLNFNLQQAFVIPMTVSAHFP